MWALDLQEEGGQGVISGCHLLGVVCVDSE